MNMSYVIKQKLKTQKNYYILQMVHILAKNTKKERELNNAKKNS